MAAPADHVDTGVWHWDGRPITELPVEELRKAFIEVANSALAFEREVERLNKRIMRWGDWNGKHL